jgi:hypothetical protein
LHLFFYSVMLLERGVPEVSAPWLCLQQALLLRTCHSLRVTLHIRFHMQVVFTNVRSKEGIESLSLGSYLTHKWALCCWPKYNKHFATKYYIGQSGLKFRVLMENHYF